jgi:polyhydroxyalkanoate synthesis regulator phasin
MIQFRSLLAFLLLSSLSALAWAQDFDAIERRLGEAIHDGEISIAQAHAMMEALKRSSLDPRSAEFERGAQRRMEAMERRLKEAVRTGLMSEEEAQAERARIERDAEVMRAGLKIRAAVARGELTAEEAQAKMEAVRKAVQRKRGDRSELEGHYQRMGISPEVLARVKAALEESRVKGEQLELTLRGMLRLIHEMRLGEPGDEMNPRLRAYFAEQVGLSAKQIERVERLATRVAMSVREDDDRRDGHGDDHDHADDHDHDHDHDDDRGHDHDNGNEAREDGADG